MAPLLRDAGHDVYTPTMTGLGEQKLVRTNEDALWAIPQYHLVCTSTIESRGAELVERARAEGRLWGIDTGHDLMITEPRRTADALLEVLDR